MKVEVGGVHHNKYNGHCKKQWVRILKATWTSPIIRKRSTCQTSFRKDIFDEDDLNDEVFNGTPKTLIPSYGVSKSSDRQKGDHATHFLGWIEKPIAQSSIWKCTYLNLIQLKGGLWCECHLQWMEIDKKKND